MMGPKSSNHKQHNVKHKQRVKRMLSNLGQVNDQENDDKDKIVSRSNEVHQEEIHLQTFCVGAGDEVDSNGSAKSNKNCDFFSDIDGHFDNRKLMITNLDSVVGYEIAPTCNYNRDFRTGFIWKWTGFKFLKNITNEKEDDDHPPIFTYWLILFETIILLFMLFVFGFGKFGIYRENITEIVWHQSNSFQPATYQEHPNIWLGPSPSDLICAGAKFTPCMRQEKRILKHIEDRKDIENDSGCCIRLPMGNSVCAQTIKSKCSKRTSNWFKLHDQGTVCGQDPRYCLDPGVQNWSTNITEWPICHKSNFTRVLKSDYHMGCRILARPCCIGIYGQCMMTSKEYCTFVKGTFHYEATLCSQVNCLSDVCGQIPFSNTPNQLYRLFVSIFVHAGIIQFIFTVIVQYVYMRRLENVLGLWKIIALYIFSGLGGNLASSIFLPNTPEMGPNASLFGLLSFLMYEIINHWSYFKYPWWIFFKVFSFLLVLLACGLFLPWVDNFANMFGLLFGFMSLFIIRPVGKKRIICVSICLLFLTSGLLYLFYKSDLVEPILPYSKYLNCIPLNDKWCSSMDITYKEIKALN